MSDTERDSFYLGSLLHDVGKFIQRSRLTAWTRAARVYVSRAGRSHAHKRYSAAFLKLFRDQGWLAEANIEHIERYVLHHHAAWDRGYTDLCRKNVPIKLIRIADIWASKERIKVDFFEPVSYSRARLQSIFSSIRLTDKTGDDYVPDLEYHDLTPLSMEPEALFPAGQSPRFPQQAYRPIIDQFKESFGKIRHQQELLPLLWKYFNTVPAQTPNRKQGQLLDRPDINLFDHSRVTAAIALCLYDEWQHGSWQGEDREIISYKPGGQEQTNLCVPCILIAGDVSGIQKFIFNVPSKKAAKSLKARSFYVQLFADVCARNVLDFLKLKPANLLYNGGGRFYILAPKYREPQLDDCRKEVMQSLLNRDFIDDELYLSLASVDVASEDFMSKFGQKWADVNKLLEDAKLQKFRQLGCEEVFKPKTQRSAGEKPKKGDLYTDIAELLRCKTYKVSSFGEPSLESEGDEWERLFRSIGYNVNFTNGSTNDSNEKTVLFNSTKFEGSYSDYRFAVKDLPRWTVETIERFREHLALYGRSIEDYLDDDEKTGEKRLLKEGDIITYSQLAFKAFHETGTEKLGILKMDVDDLGKIFAEGFDTTIRTPSRMMSLSRSLQWFFEGYMNTILHDDHFRDYIYPIFSGGDDLFMVGAWHKVFELALKIQEEFRTFVCDNPSLTLSASLMVVDEHYPVSRFAVLAEERLHEAKNGSIEKNSINVFGETLSWDEFRDARNIKEKLMRMVNDFGESKAIIHKVLHGCNGLEVLYERATRQQKANKENSLQALSVFDKEKPVGVKVWQMAWFLRDLEQKQSRPIAEEIISEYERVVFAAMKGETVNPMYIAVGARWAEFSCRKSL